MQSKLALPALDMRDFESDDFTQANELMQKIKNLTLVQAPKPVKEKRGRQFKHDNSDAKQKKLKSSSADKAF